MNLAVSNFDFLLPRRLRHAEFETLRRARLLVLALAIAQASILLFGSVIYLQRFPEAGLRIYSVAIVFFALYGLLLIFGSDSQAGANRWVAQLFMLSVLVGISWDYGHEESYSVVGAVVLPIAASALLGVRAGLFWTILGAVWAAVLMPFVLRTGDTSYMLCIISTCVTIIVGTASIAIETNRAGASERADEAAQRLRLREQAMREFIDSTFPMHVQTDKSGIVSASVELAELLGETVESLCGKRLLDIVHPEDLPKAMAQFEANGSHGLRAEVRLRHADGSWFWVEGFGVPLREGEAGTADDFPWVFAAKNIDAERRHQEALERAQRLEGVGLLAAGVAHDFNNLLTVIRGFTELTPDSEERSHIITAVDKATELTASLMRFGRIAPQSTSAVDVAASVEKWRSMFVSMLGEECDLELRLPDQPMFAQVGETQLNQVLLNLMTNAREAMPRGGHISLTVGAESDPNRVAKYGAHGADGYVLIRVSDSGKGMSQAVRERVFDPFYSTKEVGQGTGLGLASVYGIVHQQRGAIDIESQAGIGTTVSVWLPVARIDSNAPITDGQTMGFSNSDVAAQSVLLVEDNQDIRQWAERVLHDRGYSVTSSDNGDTALEMLDEEVPDLLITDIVMAGMRGTELARAARERYPNLSILFMSGYADNVVHDWREVAQKNARFLPKPFGADDLVREAETLLTEQVS